MGNLTSHQREPIVGRIKTYSNKVEAVKLPSFCVKVNSNTDNIVENSLQVYIFLLNFTEIAIIITIIQKWLD